MNQLPSSNSINHYLTCVDFQILKPSYKIFNRTIKQEPRQQTRSRCFSYSQGYDLRLTLGPMKLIPCSLHISTNTAFSARKPYPGCNIVHLRLIAADRTFGINKYLHRQRNIQVNIDSRD